MAYAVAPPPPALPVVCPRCGSSDRVGEVDARQHLGAGVWAMIRLWVCGRCRWIVASERADVREGV